METANTHKTTCPFISMNPSVNSIQAGEAGRAPKVQTDLVWVQELGPRSQSGSQETKARRSDVDRLSSPCQVLDLVVGLLHCQSL